MDNSKGEGEEEGTLDSNGGGGGYSWDICPFSDDEPTISCKLSGNNMFVELCGWTSLVPLQMSNVVRDSTQFMNPTTGRKGDVTDVVKRLKSESITLKEMKNLIGKPGQIKFPLYVHIVAKKKIDVVPYSNKLLIIPLVVVADKSGYALLCSMNEGLLTVYDTVEVGDCLLLTSCTPQMSRNSYHRGLFSEDMCLDLELKIPYYSVRNHYHRKVYMENSIYRTDFKFPAELFKGSCQIMLPSELEAELVKGGNPLIMPPVSEQYYDLVGVISYVGRIERFRMQNTCELACLVNGDIENKPVKRFVLSRWIYVIDKTSKPVPVKLFINNLFRDLQHKIVPGAIVVITHCQTKSENKFTAPFSSSSQFSQIYIEEKVKQYVAMYPTNFKDKMKAIISRDNYTTVVSRTDIEWCIGGTRTMKILSHEQFKNNIFTECPSNATMMRDLKSINRRESRRLYFRGIILKADKVEKENCPKTYYVHRDFVDKKQKKQTYTVFENHLSHDIFKNSNWYSFIRKLPPFDPDAFKLQKCCDIVKRIASPYEDLCGPLLIPAKMSKDKFPLMADLEKLDGPQYFLVNILWEEKAVWLRCIWKPSECTMEEMCKKIDAANEKSILCAVDLYCVEEKTIEVRLHDFIVDD